MAKTTKIRKSAKGEECQVRIPGWCNGNNETVVLAHRNGGGMGMKHPDFMGAYCCYACHLFVDGGWTRSDWTQDEMLTAFYEGIFNTQRLLIDKGLLKIT